MEILHDKSSHVFECANSLDKFDRTKEVDRERLINILNQANFLEKTILVNFKHAKYDSPLSLPASILPCRGDLLECFWEECDSVVESLGSYEYVHITLSDGLKHIIVEAELVKKSEFGVILRLPESGGYEVANRKFNHNRRTYN